ncbi:STAS-like domain-containing protein [Cronbergia sp. UHCC 0137]|uniref:STAS-like domain-containing protein n=1 Tax=Cronbergia sp. UHCC 0137 TaxID=3110239 RepID=UPI002B214514|nr:STAS-like domain-containing protein [Cronbergia sp. UHCC 0137]MEA5618476.1 STAS-like domain-containing protein [Cronbergia sp. UHCC 0137]
MLVVQKEKVDSWMQNLDKSSKQSQPAYLCNQNFQKIEETNLLKTSFGCNYSKMKQRIGNDNNPDNLSRFFYKSTISLGSSAKLSNGKGSIKHEILTLVGKNCITVFDGQKLYDLIHPELQANQSVELDFAGVEIFAAPFFNFAFGQLLRDIQPKNIKHLLKVSNINSLGSQILKLVIENSKRYYSDPEFRSRLDKVISEQPKNL